MPFEKIKEAEFNNLDYNKKNRIAAIEGRHNLIETKLIEIKSDNKDNKESVLFLLRDLASANALLPIIKKLKNRIRISCLADGLALEKTLGALDENTIKESKIEKNKPAMELPLKDSYDLIVSVVNSTERGLETFALASFPEAPFILIEDIYGTAEKLIEEIKKRGMRIPDAICVNDALAMDNLIKKHPDIKSSVFTTGIPTFDEIFNESRIEIRENYRKILGINEDEKLIVFFGTRDMVNVLKKIVDNIKDKSNSGKIKFIFKKHPKDLISQNNYEKIIKSLPSSIAIDFQKSAEINPRDLIIASDLVVTTHSTSTFESIYRNKPVININTPESKTIKTAIEPALKSGSSFELNSLDEFMEISSKLLFDEKIRAEMISNQKKTFNLDGKNTERLCNVIENLILKNKTYENI